MFLKKIYCLKLPLFYYYFCNLGFMLQMPIRPIGILGGSLTPSLIIFQIHMAVTIALKSSVRAVFASWKDALQIGNKVRFYPDLGSYNFGYFKADGVKSAHQVILFLKYTYSFLCIISISFVVL